LREEYRELALANDWPALEASAEPPGPPFPFPLATEAFERGRPLYWTATAGDEVPRLSLIPAEASRTRLALGLSTLALVLLLSGWGLAHFFGAASWPEQLGLVGCLGVVLFPPVPGLVFLALPAAAVSVRLAQLGRWALQRVPYPTPSTVTVSGSSSTVVPTLPPFLREPGQGGEAGPAPPP
jgi:hypothetical protein